MEKLAKKNSTQHEKLGEAKKTTYHMIDEIIEKLEEDSIYVYPELRKSAIKGFKVDGSPDGEANIEFDIVLIMRINKYVELSHKRIVVYQICTKLQIGTLLPKLGLHLGGGGPCIELDVMLVWDVGEIIEKVPSPIANRCFMMVKPGTNIPMQSITDEDDHNNRYLRPFSLLEFFNEKIEMCCRKYEPTLVDHGPCILMVVAIPKTEDDPDFKFLIDIVLTLKVNNDEIYVPKPTDIFNDDPVLIRPHYSWVRSFSIEERSEILEFIPEKKNLMRVFKFILFKSYLPSYYLKNIFLKVCHKFSNDELWSEKYLGLRLIDLLQELLTCLKNRNLPCFFQPNVDILVGINEIFILENRRVCQKLTDDEEFMLETLNKRLE
ncbi:hypothetical protein HELRODRAFT_182967 [Helobdella robusta]|uniref:Mab-21-like HhH/H2TH-like domain-containing protein n=1 Tax=Helobdella robusta TaxID=6412 RepID=T1FJ03_HELRO|nr:hypothetical protein HELRODRAFT_182967 [Helobdella robusta]ESN89958.1 hypothetical protein HELRODRAFT_182967 [Helobdella robusta]